MKFLILLLFAAFLISCQAKTQISIANSTERNTTQTLNATNGNETIERKSDIFPVDTPVSVTESVKELNSKFGNIQSGEQSVCLKIQNSNLKAGDKIQFVIPELPQKVFEAEISEKAPCKEKGFGTLDMGDITDYLLSSSDKQFLNRGFGIGVVTNQKIKISGKLATVDLDNDKKPKYFRECTSMEGLHLTVWNGKPYKGTVIWHSYYGVGYDTVPSCKDKDFKGLNDENL